MTICDNCGNDFPDPWEQQDIINKSRLDNEEISREYQEFQDASHEILERDNQLISEKKDWLDRLILCETALRMLVEEYFVTNEKQKVYAITSKADAEAFNYLAVNGFIKTVNADCDFYFVDNRGKKR